MSLGPRPYYWPEVHPKGYGNSPPIANRTGWMALAILPFVLALGAKANLISALTGVPHEKLQVFHQWSSYAMFVLGLIHTFPFIIFHIHKGDMVEEWNTSVTYWTGVATLIPQAYLTFMSIPSIRNRYYEFFKATHLIVALLFILFFFFHCDFRLSSWDYFIAAGAIYMFSLCASQVKTFLMHGVHEASIDLLPSGLVRVKIPTIISWHAGQHVFVRFLTLGLHSLTAHPFTICSISYDPDQVGKASEIVLLIKPRRGITGRLAQLAAKSPGCTKKVLLDGPFGGLAETNLAHFDHILVISGGSGGGFSLAVVEEALKHHAASAGKIQVVFATRNPAMADWYNDEMHAKLSTFNASKQAVVSVHVTAEESQGSSSPDSADEPRMKSEGRYALSAHRERPNIPDIVAAATNGQSGKHVGVFVCGPASMLHDTRNATARAQLGALHGVVEEVFLHTEPFAW